MNIVVSNVSRDQNWCWKSKEFLVFCSFNFSIYHQYCSFRTSMLGPPQLLRIGFENHRHEVVKPYGLGFGEFRDAQFRCSISIVHHVGFGPQIRGSVSHRIWCIDRGWRRSHSWSAVGLQYNSTAQNCTVVQSMLQSVPTVVYSHATHNKATDGGHFARQRESTAVRSSDQWQLPT